MKKIISAILVCVLLVGSMLVLVSCGGGLSGTYEGTLCDLKFKGDKVTVIIGDKELVGEYEIEKDDDGDKTITFDFVDEDEATDEQKEILNIIDKLLKGKVSFKEEGKKITIATFFTFEKK